MTPERARTKRSTPGSRGRWAVVFWGAVAAAGAAGCDSSPPERDLTALSSAAPVRQIPVDTTEPGELAEGEERAFGFPIPRRMKVSARFPDAIFATGYVPFEALANYVRARVDAERVDTGPVKTVFVNAWVKAAPKSKVLVEVHSDRGKVGLVVRDRTPPPVEPGLTERERWRRAGLTPDGKAINGK